MDTVLLACIALIVGFFCGCTSIGGILLIPAIVLLSSLSIHEAMATSLFTFAIMALLGTFLHCRKGSIPWHRAAALCLGALLSGFAGAKANALFSAELLNAVLALLILFAGVSAPRSGSKPVLDVTTASADRQSLVLFLLGLLVGFMAGLTGIGGPVLSVPLMIAIGFSPLTSIAVAQPLQLIAGFSGSVIYILNGAIDYFMALWVTVIELIGFYAGVRAAYCLNAHILRLIISLLCIVTAAYLLLR